MKKFRILFYRPAKDGHFVDNGIAGWTRIFNLDAPKQLICSHEEIWTPDNNGFFESGRWINLPNQTLDKIVFAGDCWTSTMGQVRSKNTLGSGVRKAPASEILKNPQRWFYAEFEIPDERYDVMVFLMADEVAYNKGYDTPMILNYFVPVGIGDDEKWICCEFSNHHGIIGLRGKQSDLYEKIVEALNDKMSPIRSAKTLWKCGCKFFNLDGSEITIK